MAEGFRAAQAFVEVTADIDDRRTLDAAYRVASGMERELVAGGERAGRGLTGALSRAAVVAGNTVTDTVTGRLRDSRGRFVKAGEDAGEQFIRGADGKLRDSRGRFVKAGEDAGDDITRGVEGHGKRSGFRAFLGFIAHAPAAGLSMATGLIRALSMGVRGPAGPALIAGLSAAAVASGPVVGAILAGGIAAGLATGATGLGIVLALRDPEIKAAASRTGNSILEILDRAVDPIRGELVESIATGEQAFRRWRPELNRIFAAASTFLRPLTAGFVGLVDRLLPGLTRNIEAARPAVDALSRGLVQTGAVVGDLFDSLSDNGPEAAAGITMAFMLLNGMIRGATFAINGFTEGFGLLMELAFRLGEVIGGIGLKMQGLPGPLGEIGDKLVQWGGFVKEGEQHWDGLRNKITGATTAGQQGTSAVTERTKLMNLSMGAAVTQAGSLSAAFQALNGKALSAREAESAYQAAIDNVTASMKANGKTLDLRTEKGRANDAALRQLITTIDQKAQATYDETAATQGTAAAEAAAAKVYAQGREQLIKSAMQMGLNKKEAIAYADKIMAIPKNWTTTAQANTESAWKKFETFDKKVRQADGTVINYTVRVTTKGDHYIPGQGTQLKGLAEGGPVEGGSGYRDDVPLIAMGGEYMVRKRSVRALEEDFGRGFMSVVNNYDKTRSLTARAAMLRPTKPITGEAPMDDPSSVLAMAGTARGGSAPTGRPWTTPGTGGGAYFAPGSITLDLSGVRSIRDLLDMLEGVVTTAQTQYVGSVS